MPLSIHAQQCFPKGQDHQEELLKLIDIAQSHATDMTEAYQAPQAYSTGTINHAAYTLTRLGIEKPLYKPLVAQVLDEIRTTACTVQRSATPRHRIIVQSPNQFIRGRAETFLTELIALTPRQGDVALTPKQRLARLHLLPRARRLMWFAALANQHPHMVQAWVTAGNRL